MLVWPSLNPGGQADGAVYPNRTDCRLSGCHSADRYRLLRLTQLAGIASTYSLVRLAEGLVPPL
jgi:hypothetical protein